MFTHLTDDAPHRRGRGFGWLRSGLFWRTFFLLSLLTTVTMASWIGMSSAVQRGPQVQQTAELVISVVTITHAALTHSAPELRRELLFELVSNEGIRIFPLETTDTVDPPPDTPLMPDIEAIVKEDPYHRHGLADFRIIEFRASQRADDIQARLDAS